MTRQLGPVSFGAIPIGQPLGERGLGRSVTWLPTDERALHATLTPPVADAGWPPVDPDFPPLMLAALNKFRAQNGAAALQLDARLVASAGYKAQHMAQYRYMDHNDPDTPGHPAETFVQRVQAFYGVFAISENIAYGDYSADAAHTTIYDADGYLVAVDKAALAEGLVQAFGSDIGHRANELNTGSVGVGFAVAWSTPVPRKDAKPTDEVRYDTPQLPFVVQDYGWDTHVVPWPAGPTPPPVPPPTPPPGPTPPPTPTPPAPDPTSIHTNSQWRQNTTGHVGFVRALTPKIRWQYGRHTPLERTPAQFRKQFTHVSG